ncbi:MAG: DUF4129 domain-containing protein [Actinomycetota bacterium]|nr:DUF4129 domain-containing protein [Actinomycetota bacterium]
MTGKPWTWLHRVVVPAVVAAVSATWISPWLSALTHIGSRGADVDWAEVALPAVVAVTASALAERWVPSRRRLEHRPRAPGPDGRIASERPASRGRGAPAGPGALGRPGLRAAAVPVGARAIAALAVVILVAMSAGLLASALGPAGWPTAAFSPWALHRKLAVGAAGLAWFLALVTWSLGWWLGRREVDEARALRSTGLAAGALAVLFVAGAAHGGRLEHLAGHAALLLLVAFPGAAAVIALVHERDLERRARQRSASRPGGAWLVALVGPMSIVAALAVLLALAIGPGAPLLGLALGRLLAWLGTVIGSIGRLFPHLRPARLRVKPRVSPSRTLPVRELGRAGPPPAWVEPVLVAVVLAVLVVILASAARWLLRRYLARARITAVTTGDDETVVDSLFAWSHLLDQLRGILRRRRRRRHDRRRRSGPRRQELVHAAPAGPDPTGSGEPLPAAGSVRDQYRRFLATAAATGMGRQRAETPAELASRLSCSLPFRAGAGCDPRAEQGPGGAGALGARRVGSGAGGPTGNGPSGEDEVDGREGLGPLTALYQRVRYGGEGGDGAAAEEAAGYVSSVVGWLDSMNQANQPSPGPEPEPEPLQGREAARGRDAVPGQDR